MAKKDSYTDQLKAGYQKTIDGLELDDSQKAYLSQRWLDQVMWMEGKAAKTQKPYYRLRVLTIVGGVIVPALATVGNEAKWLTFGVSLVVAISAGMEEFFKFGDRWRNYRNTVEHLKSEAWQFFQLAGSFGKHKSHKSAYPAFVEKVENLITRDVEVFIKEIASDEGKQKA